MRKMLRWFALVMALAAAVTWLATGANLGWTKTTVPVKTLDAVTGIEGLTYEKRFMPGVDFLGMAMLAAAALAGVSFVFPRKSKLQIQA